MSEQTNCKQIFGCQKGALYMEVVRMECWEELHGISRGGYTHGVSGGTICMEYQGGLYAWSVRGDYMHEVSGETIHVECQLVLYAWCQGGLYAWSVRGDYTC